MKAILGTVMTLIALFLSSTTYANSTNFQCQNEIINKTYSSYEDECGGAATKENCEIRTFQMEGNLGVAESFCYFSDAGEDYQTGIEASYIVDLRNCQVLSEKIKQCIDI